MKNSPNVLIIEDNLADQKLLCDALQRSNPAAKTHVIENGRDALPFLQQTGKFQSSPRPDLIILDLNLPGRNGHEILQDIKNDDALKCIPVVVFTSSVAQDDIKKVYNSRGNTFFSKPPDLYSYFDMVDEIQRYWLSLAQRCETCL